MIFLEQWYKYVYFVSDLVFSCFVPFLLHLFLQNNHVTWHPILAVQIGIEAWRALSCCYSWWRDIEVRFFDSSLISCPFSVWTSKNFIVSFVPEIFGRELRIACTIAHMEREGGISPRISPLAQVILYMGKFLCRIS